MCGRSPCPLLKRVENSLPKVVHNSKELFGASPPSVFVGRYGYPRVAAGPMIPLGDVEDPRILSDPGRWLNMPMEDMVALRSILMRPVARADVYRPRSAGSVIDSAGEIALSSIPVDTEVFLEKAPRNTRVSMDIFEAPMGPTAPALRARVVDNVVVPRRVDYIVGDTDMGASEGVLDLYQRGVGEEHIQRLLSTGQLGVGYRRRMVPTRWTITAVQDMIAKDLMKVVKTFPQVNSFSLYSHTLLGNRFHVLLVPRVWSFEMVETWLKGAFWGAVPHPFSDYETHRGRKTYANKVTGAYYAARLSVLEKLEKQRRQASCIIYREITSEYWAPLGVWVIREGVKQALSSPPMTFDTLDKAIQHACTGVDIKDWPDSSVLLRDISRQKRLEDFA